MAASLAATSAAKAQQQKHDVHAVVQVWLTPEALEEGRVLPQLQQPYLSCPVEMQIEQLEKVSKLLLCQMKHEQHPPLATVLCIMLPRDLRGTLFTGGAVSDQTVNTCASHCSAARHTTLFCLLASCTRVVCDLVTRQYQS